MRIAYVDSSVIVRRYLSGNEGHADARALFDEPATATVSSSLARIEVSGALVRAARHVGIDPAPLLARFDADIEDGSPLIVAAGQGPVDAAALSLVRRYGLRALDAIHIAAAVTLFDELGGPGDTKVFITGDETQAATARARGLTTE